MMPLQGSNDNISSKETGKREPKSANSDLEVPKEIKSFQKASLEGKEPLFPNLK